MVTLKKRSNMIPCRRSEDVRGLFDGLLKINDYIGHRRRKILELAPTDTKLVGRQEYDIVENDGC